MGSQRIRLITVIAVLMVTFGAARAATRYRLGQRRQPNWSVVPYEVDGWRGVDGRFDPVYGTDPADTSLLRVYRSGEEPPVIAYVGFFGDLATIIEVHTPELCYPAQGWGIRSAGDSMPGKFRGMQVSAKRIMVDKNGDRRLVVWWYNAGSRPFQTRIRYVYAMLVMSAFTGRTDGSIVRLETPLAQESESAAVARIADFQRIFLPVLADALPQ
jgi:EpsI family protein